MDSGRHDADGWDLASSVGATATMSAAVRALVPVPTPTGSTTRSPNRWYGRSASTC
jgi:hypothetical protein